jgi:hypothetical protein
MSFVNKLRTITVQSKNIDSDLYLNYDTIPDNKSQCYSPSYSVALRDEIELSRKKERENKYLSKINAWAVSLGYGAPNKINY